ncbi:MAG: protoporphyrinogen oxidase HemJ [Crocinitomicaceae bacterium]|nr:protoporphyrinogen oxidase HemJ [Crocinitomicaceae bacterium]
MLQEFLISNYSVWKALHIIFVVSWFAGLFYIVRLFIYHVEAQAKEEQSKKILSDQFEIMEKRLWWIITTPAMILTIVFGVLMFFGNPTLLQQGWMHLKLAFIVLLLVYHFVCQKIMVDMKNGKFKWKSGGLRLWNEVATLALVSIVFLVTLKHNFNWLKGTIGFFAVAIGLMILIKLYKRVRKNKEENNPVN